MGRAMTIRLILIGLGMTALGAGPAGAAPATAEKATELRATLEHYVGKGEANASPVSVAPKGDGYEISLDLKRSFGWLAGLGFTVEAAPYPMTATPLEGGTWHVVSTNWPEVTVRSGAQIYTVVMNGGAFDGVFDPALPGFARSSFSYDSMSVGGVGDHGDTQTRQINHSKQTSTSTANGPGITDVQAVQSNAGFNQQIVLGLAPATPGKAPDALSLKSDGATGRLAIDRLRAQALLDLWAFLVAHASEETLKASQSDLRERLRQALPLFDHFDQSGATEHLAVESPIGPFAARSVEGRLRVSGLVAQGQVESEVRIADLVIPPGLVPAWSESLVPVSGEIKESISGFHLDAPARIAVDTFDLKTKTPLPPDAVQKITAAFGALDGIVLTVAPSHLISKDLDLNFDGTVQLKNFSPDARFNIRAKGLDKLIGSIQAAGGQDATAGQVLSVLVLAKGLGKTEPDGSSSWLVVSGPNGTTVNGLALPGMKTK